VLKPHQLGEGVYALMANIPPKDNNGVVIGEKYALVIDAGINGTISRQIPGAGTRTDGEADSLSW